MPSARRLAAVSNENVRARAASRTVVSACKSAMK